MRDIVSPLDGFQSPFGVVRGAFSPSTLFASGETGAWYEPGVGSLQTASGEITEAGPGDPVGFQLDQSQGAGFSGGSFTGLGSELASQDIGDHTAVASTLSDNGDGTWNMTDSDGSVGYTQNLMTGLTVGKVYFITSTVTNNTTSGNLNLQVGTSAGGNQVFESQLDADTDGTLSGVFTATATSHWIGFRSSAFVAGDGFDFTPISVREIPGNHAVQSTAAARPTLRQTAGGLYYLEDDLVDDAINWTAPADTDYTITRINRAGTVTAQTGQSLSGSTDALVEQYVAAYVAVDRALTAGETADLAAYLEGL